MSVKSDAALSQVVKRFESGDLSPLLQVATIKRDPPVPFDGWSYRNRVLAYAQTDSTDLRGFRQWKTAGRWPRAGTAAFIWAPRHVPVKREAEDGKPAFQVAGFTPVVVFAATDTDGDEPLEQHFLIPPEPPPLMNLASDLGLDVKYVPNLPGVLGNTDGFRVHLNTKDAQVWFHELGHVLHRRLDPTDFDSSPNARKEAIADLTGTVLMELYGLGDRSGNCWRYISWFNPDPLKAIREALGIVERILTWIEGFAAQTIPDPELDTT